jgi:hypothetical protein
MGARLQTIDNKRLRLMELVGLEPMTTSSNNLLNYLQLFSPCSVIEKACLKLGRNEP